MEPDNQVDPQDQQTAEVAEETTETPELSPEEIADLKHKADVSSQNYERLKKTEAELKAAKEQLKGLSDTQTDTLSTRDVLFLAKADIHEEDVDEVLEWAKFKKISVQDAHKQLKPALEVKSEERKSAATANISPARRGPSKVSDEALLEKAASGHIPESDDEINRLVRARLHTRQ